MTMENKIKTGQEILDDFFEKINELEGADAGVKELLKKLYFEDSLTESFVKNELEKLRKEKLESDED
jgi:hypothetical protein